GLGLYELGPGPVLTRSSPFFDAQLPPLPNPPQSDLDDIRAVLEQFDRDLTAVRATLDAIDGPVNTRIVI
ncbi:MAG: hypothetical protein AAGK78_14965, partial [Planctomycetota bacterium]